MRQFSKFNVHIKHEKLELVLYEVVGTVESKIKSLMRSTCEALIQDGWSCNGTHYIDLFASHLTPAHSKKEDSVTTHSVANVTLFGFSPMAKAEDEDDENGTNGENSETSCFDAESHIRYFKEVLQYCGLDYSTLCKALMPDNTSTNIQIAKIKRYFPCWL